MGLEVDFYGFWLHFELSDKGVRMGKNFIDEMPEVAAVEVVSCCPTLTELSDWEEGLFNGRAKVVLLHLSFPLDCF